jgi:predicted helicase
MYSRFLRWASDRVDENGIVTFITNRNFLDAKEADGFRKIVVEEFAEIRIIDLGGDWKKKGRAGGGNVFGIGTGVAISFFVKRRTAVASGTEQILYLDSPVQPSEDKLAWLSSLRIADANFEHIKPDKYGYWLNQPGAEFGNALALISSGTRATKTESQERAVCKLYSLGISTNRDEWLYDFDAKTLALKVREFISRYDLVRPDSDSYGDEIKWSRNLKRRLRRGLREPFNKSRTMRVMYRPYVTRWLYRSDLFIDESGQLDSMFPSSSGVNQTILISVGNRGIFSALAADIPVSLDMFVPNAVYQTPFVRYGQSGDRHLNVTEFTLKQTQDHYSRLPKASKRVISEGDLFHYAYGVLHDPIYREKYALNLKREFPHIPFYADFWKWAAWGEKLMALHIGYETVEPWPLERIDTPDEKSRKAGLAPKPMLIPRLGIDDSSCPALCRASTPSRGRFAGRNAALYQPLADGWR